MNLKNNRGITLTALSLSVVLILILTSTIIYNSNNKVKLEKYDDLLIDIDMISSKIDNYYQTNGDIPTICKYVSQEQLKSIIQKNATDQNATLQDDKIVNPNDSPDEYYVINLEQLEGLTLNYGYGDQYKNVKSNSKVNTSNVEDEIYVINKTTHQIYFPHGVVLDKVLYYSTSLGESISMD